MTVTITTIKVTRFRTLLTPCIKKTKKNKEEKWVNSVNYLSEPWIIVIHINDNGSSIIIYRGPLIEHAKEQTILNKANYHKVYLVLIQCNKMCLWDKMIDFIRSTKLAVSAILLTTKFPSSKYCLLSSSFHCLTKLPFKLAKDLLFRKDFWVCVYFFLMKKMALLLQTHPPSVLAGRFTLSQYL